MEMACKVGTKYYGSVDSIKSWENGDIIEQRWNGFYNPDTIAAKHHCIIRIPLIDYWTARGDTNWKSKRAAFYEFKKFETSVNADGKYKLELPKRTRFEVAIKRLHFIDYEWLLEQKYITQGQYDNIYNPSLVADIVLNITSLLDIIRIKGVDDRVDPSKLLTHGSVAQGTFEVGTTGGLPEVYETWTLAEADVAATLTGDLTFEGQDEETGISTDVTWATDVDGNKLYLIPKAGAENNGTYSGARINMTAGDSFTLNDANLTDVEVSKLAMDCTGNNNSGVICQTSGSGGLITINRMLIKGDSDSGIAGIIIEGVCATSLVKNNIIFGFGEGAGDAGIVWFNIGVGDVHEIYNNTCIKNYENFRQNRASMSGTLTFKNNLAQGGLNADFGDGGGGYGTHAKNYGESDSPDALTENFHDAPSNFTNYDGDNYTMAPGGDAIATLKAGEDLTGTFTDDIDGDTRTAGAFFIGADWIDTEVGDGLTIPVARRRDR